MANVSVQADVPSQKRMTFWEHIEELRDRMKVIMITVLVFFVLFMTFSIGTIRLGSTDVPMLLPAFSSDQSNVAGQTFTALLSYLVPTEVNGHGVNITARSLADGVIVQIKTALFLAVLVDLPVIVYEFARFVSPALKPSEKRLIMRTTIPILVLFLSGVALCFVIVLPFTFRLLFSLQGTVGVTFYQLYIDDFASFVLLFLLAFGLAFQLPVVMYGLSAVGIAGAGFWKKYWRFAVIAIFAFGAIITPDGSGVTMMLVALPMLALYVLGYAAARRAERGRVGAKSS